MGRWMAGAAVGVVLALGAAACGSADVADVAAGAEGPVPLRLGYFPNVTHAPAIVGLEAGILAEALGGGVELTTVTFSTGTSAIEALFSGAIDATYIGPNPAINAHVQSGGTALRIVSGTTSGGAFLVVREGIDDVEDLRGARLATPSLGNTQDVALRAWLADNGLETDLQGGGDVQILPQENSQTLETFITGDIDGAWVPEPWATRLVLEAEGRVLVDERDLWPDGRFVTTHLVVATEFLDAHPEVVRDLLAGHVEAVDRTNADAAAARTLVNAGIEAITGAEIPQQTIEGAWANLTFTVDPVATSLLGSAEDAEAVGLLEPVDLDGIYALDLLNEILAELGRDPVEGA
jgi:NitT/TauT family transport system substrate-binding protein